MAMLDYDSFRQGAIEAAARFFKRFFIYEGQPLITALLGSCDLALVGDEAIEIYCPNVQTVLGLGAVDWELAWAARFLCLPPKIRLKIGTELIREIDLSEVDLPLTQPSQIMQFTDIEFLYPPGISEAELIARVLLHPLPAVLVIEEAVVAVSQPYADLTERSIAQWISDWVGPVHGNQTRHLPGVREKLVADLERSPNGLLLNYEWPAIFCVDGSVRKFRAHFQRVDLAGRSGRMLVLLGVPEPIASPELVKQGCR